MNDVYLNRFSINKHKHIYLYIVQYVLEFPSLHLLINFEQKWMKVNHFENTEINKIESNMASVVERILTTLKTIKEILEWKKSFEQFHSGRIVNWSN